MERGLLAGPGKGALIQAAKVTGLALLGGAVFLVVQKPSGAPEVPLERAPPSIQAAPHADTTVSLPAPPQPLPERPKDASSAAVTRAKTVPNGGTENDTDTLSQELSLVREARRAVESGQAVLALQVLDRYAVRYPRGKLQSEALATRVLALCELGDETHAKAVARHLKADSPLSERMKTGCKSR